MWRLLVVERDSDWSVAFAPASVGNVAVGFDLMGHALVGLGDRASVRVVDEPGVRILSVGGVVQGLTCAPTENTAGAALLAMSEGLKLDFGFELGLEKGVALGSGMGGSGALGH